jgi:Holliday junction resolvase RusA-like endonuclease
MTIECMSAKAFREGGFKVAGSRKVRGIVAAPGSAGRLGPLGEDEIRFRFDGLPPSVNRLYRTFVLNGKVRRAKTKEGKRYEKAIAFYCHGRTLRAADWYEIELHLYLPLYFKNGKPRKVDTDSGLKCVKDSLCRAFGFDDSMVRSDKTLKTNEVNVKPYHEIVLRCVKKEETHVLP